MRLFLDTEFTQTDLLRAEIVSIALAGEDGVTEFYAERDPLPAKASDFVRGNVYPLLDRGNAALRDVEFTARLRAFLLAVEGPHIVADFAGDAYFLRVALSGFNLPAAEAARCGEVPDARVTIDDSDFLAVKLDAWFHRHSSAKRHHALIDARALREVWLALQSV